MALLQWLVSQVPNAPKGDTPLTYALLIAIVVGAVWYLPILCTVVL